MYKIPFQKGYLDFELSSDYIVDIAGFPEDTLTPLKDPENEIEKAVKNPFSGPPLSEIAKPDDKVCIVFTDITRASPDDLFAKPILKELEKAGVKNENITFVCAIGMHRPSTYEEKIEKLGKYIVENYKVIDSEPQNPQELIELGITESGVPLSVNKTAYNADLLIATGIVEPHQYAGYSGGRKTLAVGAAGEKMIEYTHGPKMLDHPNTRLGMIEGNPFHEALEEAAGRAKLTFVVNAILNHKKKIVAVKAGKPGETFLELVKIAKKFYEVPISKQYDIAIAGVGYPKDTNIYQASRAPSYLFFAPTPVIKENGFFIVPAPCDEGPGDGIGEQRFYEAMKSSKDINSILADARKYGYKPGEQRAFVMAKVLEKTNIIFTNTKCPDLIREMKMQACDTIENAIKIATQKLNLKKPEILIVPNALLTLPVVTKKEYIAK